VHALLKSVSHAGIQVLTPVRVPIRCPLKIAIAGCRPFQGEAFYFLKRSTVDVASSTVSILCKNVVAPGSRVRLASNDWILLGVVKNEAAFPADPGDQAFAAETIFRISFVAPQTLAGRHSEAQEGVEL
jgi:hypothetical protein